MGVWSFVDVILLIIGVITICFNLFRQIKVDEILESLLEDDSKFFDFDFLCYWQIQFQSASAFLVFLAWIKVKKNCSSEKIKLQCYNFKI